MLLELAPDYPLLASLVERRGNGQRMLSPAGAGPGSAGAPDPGRADSPGHIASPGTGYPLAAIAPDPDLTRDTIAAPDVVAPSGVAAPAAAASVGRVAALDAPLSPPSSASREASSDIGGDGRARRAGRYGLSILFAEHVDDVELGRLVDATVWVNAAHPAYRRAVASRSEGYHVALAVALALAPLAVEPAREHAFITAFLLSWGEALTRRGRRRARSRRP